MKNSIDDDLSLPSSNSFSQQIEEIVWMKDVPYMEAVLIWCEERGFEVEVAAELIKKVQPIKEAITAEAEGLKFIKPAHTGKLPI